MLRAARTKRPLAATVVPIQEHAPRSLRALVPQARTQLRGAARLPPGGCAKGLGDGSALWWLDQGGIPCGVPATATRAGTAAARAQAAAGEEGTVGRRVHTVRHGQGRTAWSERLETEGVGSTGRTTSAQYGTAAPRRHATRRDFQANPIQAVVVRTWHGRE